MKTIRKGLALLLALLMALSLSGCGSLQALKTMRKIQNLESYRADCSIDMSIGLGMFGQSFMNMDFRIAGTADVNRDPLRGAGEFRMDLMGETQEGQFYFAKDGDQLMLYTSADGGDTWKAGPVDLNSSSPESGFGLSKESLVWLTKTAADFEEAGEEDVNGYAATVYEGSVSGAELKALMDESDLLGTLAEAMEISPDELEMKEIGDIPITVALDNKTGLPVRLTVDLSGLMESLLPFFLQVGMKASSDGGEDADEMLALISMMDVSFDECMITVLLSDFDKIGEITIPDEVIAAAKSPVSVP